MQPLRHGNLRRCTASEGMTAPARFRQADLKRALKVAQESGYETARVRFRANGEMEVIVSKSANDEEADDLE